MQHELISRSGLLRRLGEVLAARVTSVRAPAGYGKTSLLRQWRDALEADGALVAAVEFESKEREPRELLKRLAGAVQKATGAPSPADAPPTAAHASHERLSAQLAQACTDAPAPVYLLLDDVHRLAGSDSIRCLQSLIEHAPAKLHVVLASRETLDLPFARWRALGAMSEITERDLRFSSAEIGDFLARLGVDDPDAVRLLEARSEGWAVGLRLAASALASRGSRPGALKSLSGEWREIADFFAEDVMAGQPGATQEFLRKISILDTFCAQLCDAVTGLKNGREMLNRCERSGLFVVAQDDARTWYRLHPLFREFLARASAERREANPALLHSRASAWFVDAGMFDGAFDHALKAADPMRAAGILDDHLDSLFGAGQARVVPALAAKIPLQIQAFFPRIMLASAWPMAMHWQFAEVRDLIAASRARIADLERMGTLSKLELQTMKRLLAHGEMMLAQFQDDMPAVEAHGASLLRDHHGTHPFVMGSIYSAYLNGQREQFKLGDVDRLDAAARECLDRCEGPQVHIAHEAVMGVTRFAMGDSAAAIARLRNGLAITVRVFGDGVPLGAKTALPLAEVLYERNATEEAAALIEKYLPLANKMGFVDQLVGGWLTHARLLRMRGDTEGALSALTTADAIAAQHGFDRLALFAAEERARQLLRSGRLDEVGRVARQAGIGAARASAIPPDAAASRDEARALMWVTLAETKNHIGDALDVARQWRGFTAGAGALRSVIRWDVRIAHLLLLGGQARSAKRTLRRAIALAAPGRYMRSFLDEPELLGALLGETAAKAEPGDTAESFAAQLLQEYERENGSNSATLAAFGAIRRGTGGTLNSPEREVLKLMASGLSNREVGDRLGLTESSVKWHLQQIYNKIGVRRRMLAVERARLIGLIR